MVGGRLVGSGNEAAGQLGSKSTRNLLKLFHNFNRISRFCIIYFYIIIDYEIIVRNHDYMINPSDRCTGTQVVYYNQNNTSHTCNTV